MVVPPPRPARAGRCRGARRPDGTCLGCDQPFTITLVARPCRAYTDVMAKPARNDVQESLRDLGKNSVYPSFDTAAGRYADNIVVSARPGMTDACRRSP